MKRIVFLLLGLMGCLPACAEKAPVADRPVFVIPIRDEIEQSIVYVVRRGVKEAIEQNAQAIILDMNTNGGLVSETEKIMELLGEFKGDTVTFVNNKAFSAGAFIAICTRHIYMAPSSVIGAAAPIMIAPGGGGPQEMPSVVQKKISSGLSALMRAAAERNGHNPAVVDAMVKETDGLTIDGKEIVKKGDILTLTVREATAEYGKPPKPLLAAGTANGMDDLFKKLGYSLALKKEIQPTGAEHLARWITLAAPILLLIGIGGIYLEVKTPGVTLPGVVGVIALLLFFFGHYVAGLSGSEEIILFAVGLALICVEIFVLPGHVLPGFLGVVAILIAVLWAMVDKIPNAPLPATLPKMEVPLLNLMGSIIGAAVIIGLMARYLPQGKGPLAGFILQTQLDKGAGYASADTHNELVGQKGVALSMLRPSGTARFGEKVVDVITEGDFIPPNAPIVVKEVRGVQVIVGKA
jgi:membrane-bound serine protease (ClpP class)